MDSWRVGEEGAAEEQIARAPIFEYDCSSLSEAVFISESAVAQDS